MLASSVFNLLLIVAIELVAVNIEDSSTVCFDCNVAQKE
jgi:hypothetical protein